VYPETRGCRVCSDEPESEETDGEEERLQSSQDTVDIYASFWNLVQRQLRFPGSSQAIYHKYPRVLLIVAWDDG
jgi:hypothetical protein